MSQPTRHTGQMDRRTFFTAVAGGAVTWAALHEVGAAQTAGGTVETTAGKVRGHVRMGIHSFKGIPYGASTSGARRFMAPVKAAPWTGVREAVRYGHQSPQNMRFTEVLAPQADPAELFAWQSPALGGRLRATHTVEIPFVFDHTHIPKTMTGGGPDVKALAAQTSDAWIAFARSGNPNHKGLPTWPAYTTAQRGTMVFDAPASTVVNDPGHVERELWASLG